MTEKDAPIEGAAAPDAAQAVLDEVRPEATALERADVALGAGLAARGEDHPVVRAAAKLGALGDQEPLYAAGAALAALGLILRNGRLAGTGAAMVAAVGAADGSKRLVKRLVRRTRPNVLLGQGRYAAGVGGTGEKHEQSFPSGHVAGSLAAALAVSRRYPTAGTLACLAAAAVGVGRVARGAHWPLDVAAGALIGVAAEQASEGLLRVMRRPVARSRNWLMDRILVGAR